MKGPRILFGAAMVLLSAWNVAALALMGTLPPTTCIARYDQFTVMVVALTLVFSCALSVSTVYADNMLSLARDASQLMLLPFGLNMGMLLVTAETCVHQKAVLINLVSVTALMVALLASWWVESCSE